MTQHRVSSKVKEKVPLKYSVLNLDKEEIMNWDPLYDIEKAVRRVCKGVVFNYPIENDSEADREDYIVFVSNRTMTKKEIREAYEKIFPTEKEETNDTAPNEP